MKWSVPKKNADLDKDYKWLVNYQHATKFIQLRPVKTTEVAMQLLKYI